VVVDQESLLATPYPSWRELTRRLVNTARAAELPRLGTPVDYLELDDALAEGAGGYRMVIFLNPYLINNQERRGIEERLKRDGKTLVWLYAPGLINPDARVPLALEHMEELTGMRFGCLHGRAPARWRIDGHHDPITANLPTFSEWGDFDRPTTTGFEMNRDTMAPWVPAPMMVNPLFYVDDSECTAFRSATVLGSYLQGGQPAFAVKRFPEWTSVYLGSPAANAGLLRAVARAAGAHRYVDGDDIVYANRSFVAIHTREAGQRTVCLRAPSDAYEVFDDQLLAQGVKQFDLHIPAYTTRLIFLGDVPAFRKALD